MSESQPIPAPLTELEAIQTLRAAGVMIGPEDGRSPRDIVSFLTERGVLSAVVSLDISSTNQ